MNEGSESPPKQKTCTMCRLSKPLDDYGPVRKSPDGGDNACRHCRLQRKYSQGKTCPSCSVPIMNRSSRCKGCMPRGADNPTFRPPKWVIRDGERLKTCVTCEQPKPLDRFGTHKGKPGDKHYSCLECWRLRRYSDGNTCSGCGERVINKSTHCRSCVPRGPEAANFKTGRFLRRDGYIHLSGHRGHPNAYANGYIPEHVYVMSQYLGRPLIKGESVHHKNGVRDDNRLENLELWSRGQPAGQRIADKVAWAREILKLYADYEDPEQTAA